MQEQEQKQMKRFHKAVCSGDYSEVEKLIADGFNSFTTPNTNGMTPLHYAAWGARGNAIHNDAPFPQMNSPPTDHVKIAKLLITEGIPISPKNIRWQTPLHLCSYDGNPEMAALLLSNGADTISLNSSGYTAAELALVLRRNSVAALIGAEVMRRQIVAEEEVRRVQYEAFAMGHHERLGEGSLVRWLDPGVVRIILEYV